MEEQLIEELNNALAVLWKTGRKAETLVDIKRLEKSALLALSMGFDSESDDGIDYDAAYFNFQRKRSAARYSYPRLICCVGLSHKRNPE